MSVSETHRMSSYRKSRFLMITEPMHHVNTLPRYRLTMRSTSYLGTGLHPVNVQKRALISAQAVDADSFENDSTDNPEDIENHRDLRSPKCFLEEVPK